MGLCWQEAMVPTLSRLADEPLPLPRPHQLMQFKQLLKAMARWEEGLCSTLPYVVGHASLGCMWPECQLLPEGYRAY